MQYRPRFSARSLICIYLSCRLREETVHGAVCRHGTKPFKWCRSSPVQFTGLDRTGPPRHPHPHHYHHLPRHTHTHVHTRAHVARLTTLSESSYLATQGVWEVSSEKPVFSLSSLRTSRPFYDLYFFMWQMCCIQHLESFT